MKHLIKVTLTCHYTIEDSTLEEFYGTPDISEALKIDRKNFENDPYLMLTGIANDDIEVQLEIGE